MFAADNKPLDGLSVFAQVSLDPPHIAENLPHNTIRRSPFFQFDHYKCFRLLLNRKNINGTNVGCILLTIISL